MRSTELWTPQIAVPLPQLYAENTLQLEILTDYYDGRQMVSILETLTVN